MASGPQKNKVLLEAILVAVGGLIFGLVANQLSPNGVSLGRNYFFLTQGTNVNAVPPTNSVAGTNAIPQTARDKLAKALQEKGLQLADSNQVFKLYNDPRYAMELVVFIDARNDKEYQEGHVPGAYQVNYYSKNFLEGYLLPILPVCQTAEQIICYCNGGDCEDSQHVAMALAEQKVPNEKLFVYDGGFAEWSTNGWPAEIGARKSNVLRPQPTNSTAGAK